MPGMVLFRDMPKHRGWSHEPFMIGGPTYCARCKQYETCTPPEYKQEAWWGSSHSVHVFPQPICVSCYIKSHQEHCGCRAWEDAEVWAVARALFWMDEPDGA